MKIEGKAPTEDPQKALREMDYPSRESFLFVGGPLDGKRCHVEMTTHGPDNIVEIRGKPDAIPIPGMMGVYMQHASIKIDRYIRHPMHERDGKIHFVYQHEADNRNVIAALIEGYAKP